MANVRLSMVMIILTALLIFLQYRLWFESGGVKELRQLKKTLAQQTLANETLKKRNEALMLQINHLKINQEATESRARNELGMIKKGETFYQVVK